MKVLSWAAPAEHPAETTPVIVYGPPGPEIEKSETVAELHKTFSEKLAVMDELPHETVLIDENVGVALS